MRSPRSRRSASIRRACTVTREAPAWFHPGRSGALKLGPKTVLGVFGEFHPDLLATLGIDPPIAGFELYLDAVPPRSAKARARRSTPPTFSRCRRDFAFVLDDEVAAGDVVRAALAPTAR